MNPRLHTTKKIALVLLGMTAGQLLTARASFAQETPRRALPRDSLAAELRSLRARLDSLEQVVARLRAERRDTAKATDELAALRAAAARAAGTDTSRQEAASAGRGRRNLNRLNPEISLTGDVRLQAHRPGPQEDLFDAREFEFSFQAALDPYASTKVFLSWEDGEIDLEEGYAYWSGLPGGLRLDLGRLRQQLGELNRTHLHALPQSEYPLVLQEYFGEDGLIADGARIYWLAPWEGLAGATHEAYAEVAVGRNDVLFDGGNRPSFLGHINNFWQLSSSSFFQLGFTGLYGRNPEEDLRSRVLGFDARYTWRPPGRALYRSLTLRAEVYGARQRRNDEGGTRWGGYVGAEYQFARSWFAGLRIDWVEPLDRPRAPHDWQIVPGITWFQSEWVHLRAEWQHLSTAFSDGSRDASDRFVAQVVWAVGPHKHESY